MISERYEGFIMEQRNSREQANKRLLWVISVVALLVAVGAWWGFSDKEAEPVEPTELYASAVTDAVEAEQSEIEPLVELTKTSPLTTWDEKGRVLLVSWHRHPERYIEGEEISLSEGSIWTFTDKEIETWYKENKEGVTDWELRLEQLIGLPPEAEYTHVSGFWVDPTQVVRPAYVTDITAQMDVSFQEGTDQEFKEWFEGNIKFSYEESAYPWTRLGYTYDWADNGEEYGLTEFLVEENAKVQVAFTKTTDEFLTWLENGRQ